MNTHADPTLEKKSNAAANRSLQRSENGESASPLQVLADNSRQVRQLKGYQKMANSSSVGVIQMIRPTDVGWYMVKGNVKRWYKGEAVGDDGYYNFYTTKDKKMSQKYKEEDILSKVKDEEEEAGKLATPTIPPLLTMPSLPASSSVGFSGKDQIHDIKKVSAIGGSDPFLSGTFPEEPGDFDEEYQTRIQVGNTYYQRINNLILKAKVYMATLPKGYVGLWRFHMTEEEYQSHAYKAASKEQEVVPNEVLTDAITNLEILASHMYESSKKHTSPGISFSRSIDSLIDASFHTGADSVLRAVIFGGKDVAPAKFLSFVAIPRKELVFPEDVPVPKGTQNRDRKGEARGRSLKELEALHIPLPGSGGKTHDPLFTVKNPFPEKAPLPGQQPLLQPGPLNVNTAKLKTLDLRGVSMHWTQTLTLIEAIEKGQLPNLTKLVVRAESITPDLRGRALARVEQVEVIK